MEVIDQIHILAALPRRKSSRYPLDKSLGGLLYRSGRCGVKKKKLWEELFRSSLSLRIMWYDTDCIEDNACKIFLLLRVYSLPWGSVYQAVA
jgi:hypothetical protein